MSPDNVMVWPDGNWCYAGEFCWETDRWRGDDYTVLASDTVEWYDFLLGEGVLV